MNPAQLSRTVFLLTLIIFAGFASARAQTPTFTYQGRFTDSSVAQPTNGNYNMQFTLHTADTGAALIQTLPAVDVAVTNGVFTVNLNFTAANAFDGNARFLEIAVRRIVDPQNPPPFNILTPRQPLTSSPYSIRAVYAATATNALNLGNVAANLFIQEGDARLTDPRTPAAGSANYIQNQNSAAQTLTSFRIDGTGAADVFNAVTQYNIGGGRVLSVAGSNNTFAGFNAGTVNTGVSNSFFGRNAGSVNTGGGNNSFVGRDAGRVNSIGATNSFFGVNAGLNNVSGSENVFVGVRAGNSNIMGSNNTAIGTSADVVGINRTFATAIGSGAVVSANNTVVLGRSADAVQIPGNLDVSGNLNVSGTLSGSGADLTNLNGANIAAGSITGAQLNDNARSKFDTNLVALQRWDLLPNFKTIPISSPIGFVFDGTFVNVLSGNNMVRIRASTGLVEGSPIALGGSPAALTFDGTFIYVTLFGSASVRRIRASTGAVEGSLIAVGTFPQRLVFDGTFVYVANANSDNVTRIRASTGLVEGSPIPVGDNPKGLAFDGTFVYVANTDSDNVTRIRAATGVAEGSPIPVGNQPDGFVFDGTFVYVANNADDNVMRIRASTGAVEGSPIVVGDFPQGLAFDGTFVYVTNTSSGSVTRIRASTGLVEGSPIPINAPVTVGFDGVSVYVIGSNAVTRFVP